MLLLISHLHGVTSVKLNITVFLFQLKGTLCSFMNYKKTFLSTIRLKLIIMYAAPHVFDEAPT